MGKQRKLEAHERKKVEADLARQRKQEAESRSYTTLFAAQEQDRKERLAAGESSEDEAKAEKQEGDFDSDDDFM